MTSGRVDACVFALLVFADGAAETAGLDTLLRSLAREPPQSIAFVETHVSLLLEQDLVVSGVLEYHGKNRLSRVVMEPYRERIDIDGSDLVIRRERRPERRFSLDRKHAQGGLLAAFSALLAGDREALEIGYVPSVTFMPSGWQLELTPKELERHDRFEKIRVRGEGNAPACIEILAPDGSPATVIRLGTAATDVERPSSVGCDGPADE